MAEYIEREALIKELNNIALDLLKDKSIQCSLAAGTVVDIKDNVVAKQPTADVVEVVRCCKCKYGNKHNDCNGNEYYGCDINIDIGEVREVEPTHYCSYGERRCEE